jgi:hypothetical protein
MKSFNTIHLCGRLTRTPYAVSLSCGRSVVYLAVATSSVSLIDGRRLRRCTHHVVLLPHAWVRRARCWEANQFVSVTGKVESVEVALLHNGSFTHTYAIEASRCQLVEPDPVEANKAAAV